MRRRPHGQSLVELALILPVMLTILGAAVDIARLYGASVALDGATRDAAEQVATLEGTSATFATAQARAQAVVCAQLVNAPGYVGAADGSTCSQPSISLTWSTPTTSGIGTSKYPLGSAVVTTTLPFQMLFPYPLFTQNGVWNLRSTQSYSVIQNR